MKNHERLEYPKGNETSVFQTSVKQKQKSVNKVLFSKHCIFCNKEGCIQRRRRSAISSENATVFDMGGGKTIQEVAERRGDQQLLTKIRGMCLFLVEAHCHPSCRKKNTRLPGVGRSEDEERYNKQCELEVAHKLIFEKVCTFIHEKVATKKEVLKLSDLCKYYKELLDAIKFPNAEYRAKKLKAKVLKHDIGSQILFTEFEHGCKKFSSVMVFSNSVKTADAVKVAYSKGVDESLSHVGITLRESIRNSFSKYPSLPWPPSVEYL